MSYDDKELVKDDYKDPLYNTGNMLYNPGKESWNVPYSIIAVGAKYHKLNKVKGFESHCLRKIDVKNACKELSSKNTILKGPSDLYDYCELYLGDTPYRKNAVLFREMILSASRCFFKDKSEDQVNRWIKVNHQWLEMKYGDRYIFAVTHLDEGAATPHIHILLGTKFYDVNKQVWKFQHNKMFDGPKALMDLHTEYHEYMHEYYSELTRGVKASRAKYEDVKAFYGALDDPTIQLTPEQALAKAQLWDKENKKLTHKVNSLSKMNEAYIKDKSLAEEQRDKLDSENKLFKAALQELMFRNSITQKEWDTSLESAIRKGTAMDAGKQNVNKMG